jgi:hypothetical protein
LIAEAFQKVGYPVLPIVTVEDDPLAHHHREILHIRHHSLYTPRDFDISPYFRIVKPTLECDFDYCALQWAKDEPGGALG